MPDTLNSAVFRVTYPKLTRPTVVTVNGRPIGTWTPSVDEFAGSRVEVTQPSERPVIESDREMRRMLGRVSRGSK